MAHSCERMSRMSLGCGRDGRARLTLDEPVERGRGQRALAPPVGEPLPVDEELHRLVPRVVRTDVLEKFPASSPTVVGDDDTVEGALLGAGARKTNVNGHRNPLCPPTKGGARKPTSTRPSRQGVWLLPVDAHHAREPHDEGQMERGAVDV